MYGIHEEKCDKNLVCHFDRLIAERLVETAASAYERVAAEEDSGGNVIAHTGADEHGSVCSDEGGHLPGNNGQHGSASCTCPELAQIQCRLESKDLWDRFHDLGTEMIITKSGRYDLTHKIWQVVKTPKSVSMTTVHSLILRNGFSQISLYLYVMATWGLSHAKFYYSESSSFGVI